MGGEMDGEMDGELRVVTKRSSKKEKITDDGTAFNIFNVS